MKFQMRKCKECGEYTLEESCPECNVKTGVIFPATNGKIIFIISSIKINKWGITWKMRQK